MTIDQRFFINEILDPLIDKHSFLLQSRLQAIIKRTEKNYCNATIYDYIVEALCDSEFFKKDTFLTEKEFIISNIKSSIDFHKEINLIIPIFSRKPLSPIKNNGVNPDLGEINSLLRFYSLAKLITNLSEVKCNFIILSDGHKYNRACLTPKYIVDNYQRSLRYWIRELSLSDYVKFFDYEEWIQKDKDHNWLNIREELYKSKYKEL
ncbi:L-tyrosine/L-tryptophan isonitrile synthase family protein, partial [Avibacterium avium]|uniref:L-tyrosine/L-tryptophan isonitrile synthase family protein n=5 Tax=Avibacterium avium TaxID=751 RepID=UPI003BF8121E